MKGDSLSRISQKTKNIYSWTFGGGKKIEKIRGCPSVGDWLNKLWSVKVMEYYWVTRDDELLDFCKNWKDLHGLMQREMNRTRRISHIVTETIWDDQM